MSTSPHLSALPERPTLQQIWQVLTPLLADSWTPPIEVDIHPDLITVSIQYPPNNRGAVDAAFGELQVDRVPAFSTKHFWHQGEPSEWTVYGRYWVEEDLVSPLLPRLRVRIYCHVETQADASEHWDGLTLHPAMVTE